jgi:hypothetical protein
LTPAIIRGSRGLLCFFYKEKKLFIALSIWFLIGIATAIFFGFMAWHDGEDLQVNHLPVVGMMIVGGAVAAVIVAFFFISIFIEKHSKTVVIKGRNTSRLRDN